MPDPLFVDSSALIALFVPRDERHEEAKAVLLDAQRTRRPLFASTDVFDEVITFLCRRAGPEPAVRIGDELRREEVLRLVRVDDEIRERAWAIFKARRLPALSFTDCTSSAILSSRRIREVFTFDDDFRRLGHRVVPGPRPLLRPRDATPRGRRGVSRRAKAGAAR